MKNSARNWSVTPSRIFVFLSREKSNTMSPGANNRLRALLPKVNGAGAA